MKLICIACISLASTLASAQKPVTAKFTGKDAKPEAVFFAKQRTYVSPVISIKTKVPVAAPTVAQATDRLLWYKGKKIDDSTIITPQATTVRWSKQNEAAIVQLKTDPFAKTIQELLQTGARKDKLFQNFMQYKSGVAIFPIIDASLNDWEAQFDTYFNLLKNTIDVKTSGDGASIGRSNSIRTGGTAALSKFIWRGIIPERIILAHAKLMEQVKNYPPLEIVPPPLRDFSCTASFCPDAAPNEAGKKVMQWMEKMMAYEKGISESAFRLSKELTTLGLQNDPEAAPLHAGIEKAIQLAMGRIKNKSDQLFRQYGTEFRAAPAIIQFALGAERQQQLLGMGAYEATMSRILALLDGYEKYVQKAMDEKNYDIALNLKEILGMERQRQLLGTAGTDHSGNWIEKWQAFNRFKLDMSVEYSSREVTECGESTDAVSAKLNKGFWLSLVPSQNCRYSLNPHEQHHKNEEYHFPGIGERVEILTGAGTRYERFKDDNDKCMTTVYNYSNLPLHPAFSSVVSFCDDGKKDSLILEHLVNSGVDIDDKNSLIYSFINEIFMDYGNSTPDQHLHLEDELESINIRMEDVAYNPPNHKTLNFNQAKEFHQMVSRSQIINQTLEDVNPSEKRYFAVFDAVNGNAELLNVEIPIRYADELSDQKATVKSKIKITHDPLPYKSAAK